MPIFLHTLRGYRWPLLFVGAGLFAFSFLLCYTYKVFGGAEGLGRFIQALPPALQSVIKAFGFFEPTARAYIANGYHDPRYMIILSGFAIGNAASTLAGEIERGTILYLLARPVSRASVVLWKMAALAVAIVVLVGAGFLGTVLGSLVNGFAGEVPLGKLAGVQVMLFALILLVCSVTLLLSARSSERGHVLAVSAGLFVTLYSFDFLAEIWPSAGFLGPLSPFHYLDPQEIMRDSGFPWRDLAILGATSLIASALAVLVFRRRDITR